MSETLNTSSPQINVEAMQPSESLKESEKYLKLAREHPHTLTEEIKKNPKTEPLLRKFLGDNEYERIKNLNPINLSENTNIAKIQTEIYAFVGINPETDRNPTKEKFFKGLIDSIIVDNIELAMQIIETKGAILMDMINQIRSWEGLKQIAEGLGRSVMNIFSGDAYKTGKSVGELGLITTGAGAGGFLLKKIGKTAIKMGEGIAIKAGEKTVLSQAMTTGGKSVETAGKVVQAPYNGAKWVGGKMGEGIKIGLEKTGVSGVIRSATEPVKKVIKEGVEQVSPTIGKVIQTTKQRSKEILAIATTPLLVGSKDGRNQVAQLERQIGAIGDIENIKQKIRITPEAYLLYKEKPDLQAFHELLGNIRKSDILGEGQNGIVVRNPKNPEQVIKIPKAGKDDIMAELVIHQKIADWLLEGQTKKEIPKFIKIPSLSVGINPNVPKHYIMDRLDGQAILTKQILAHPSNAEILSRYPHHELLAMTDFQVTQIFKDLGVKPKITVAQVASNIPEEVFFANTRLFLDTIQQEGLEKTIGYLKSRGMNHNDLHTGNIMINRDNTIVFMIDFGKATAK